MRRYTGSGSLCNELLPWSFLFPRKHLENTQAVVPVPTELPEFELWATGLASQIKHILAAYNASYDTKFVDFLDNLTRLLKKVLLTP